MQEFGGFAAVALFVAVVFLLNQFQFLAESSALAGCEGHVWCLICPTVFSVGNNAYGQCGRKIVEEEVYRFVS